jgi:hypothetical protein
MGAPTQLCSAAPLRDRAHDLDEHVIFRLFTVDRDDLLALRGELVDRGAIAGIDLALHLEILEQLLHATGVHPALRRHLGANLEEHGDIRLACARVEQRDPVAVRARALIGERAVVVAVGDDPGAGEQLRIDLALQVIESPPVSISRRSLPTGPSLGSRVAWARWPRALRCSTSRRTCVVVPAPSRPSITIKRLTEPSYLGLRRAV